MILNVRTDRWGESFGTTSIFIWWEGQMASSDLQGAVQDLERRVAAMAQWKPTWPLTTTKRRVKGRGRKRRLA